MKLSAEQLDAVNYNYFQGMGTCYLNSTHGLFLDAHEYSIFYSGDPGAQEFNMANVKTESPNPELVVELWERYFKSVAGQFRVVLSPWFEPLYQPLLETRGYQKIDPFPGMVLLDAASTLERNVDPDVCIKKVSTAAEFADFLGALEDAYDYADPADEAKWALTQTPHCALFVAYVDQKPAALSMSYITGDVVGVYWVGTEKAFRKRGLGAAVTWRAVQEGVDRGCTLASLQASPAGEPVYARMGFGTPIQYVQYNAPK